MCKARPWNQRNSLLIYKRRENHISLCHSISLEVLGVFFFLGATFRFGAAVFITLCFRCPFTQMLNDLFCWSASIVVGAYRMCRPYKMYLCVLLINETRCKRFNNNFCLQLVCCLHNNSQLQFEQLTNYCFAFFRSALLQSNRFFSPLEPLGEAETDSYTCNGMVH